MNIGEITQKVVEISKQVGDWMLEERKQFSQEKIEEKSFNNLVSYVDKEAEKKFVTALSNVIPEAGFVAEEGTSDKKGIEYDWIIDPLDGTTNFIYNVPVYCTSVALVKNRTELLSGVIYDPNRNECFYASKGNGAFLNGDKIQVAKTKELEKSLIATGFPYDDFKRQKEYLNLLLELMHNSRSIRRLGSAAIDLAYVACGRFEAFYEYGLNAWDVAAGAIIVEEAGGLATDFSNGNNYIFGEEILATNKHIHEKILKKITHFFIQ